MMNTSREIDFDNDDQIRLLTNLREDIRSLLAVHRTGIWFRMLPKVFYMHFNRDIHLDLFAINNPFLFLDYILDMIEFELPKNLNEEDFIIELKNDEKQFERTMDLKARREMLLKILQNASLEERGGLLRQICMIDEQLKQKGDAEETVSMPTTPTHEQVALRLQKIRSMIDFYLRHLLQSSNEVSDQELIEVYENAEEFICHLTPLVQRLSSSTN